LNDYNEEYTAKNISSSLQAHQRYTNAKNKEDIVEISLNRLAIAYEVLKEFPEALALFKNKVSEVPIHSPLEPVELIQKRQNVTLHRPI
jgi:hypothetical protein